MAAATIFAAAGFANAASFRAAYTGQSNGITVSVANFGTVNAGYMNFSYENGSNQPGIGQFGPETDPVADRVFKTFCIENFQVTGGQQTWNVVDIANAPVPANGPSYGAPVEARVNAIVAAAIHLQWIKSDLSEGVNASAARAAALQAGIWAALDGTVLSGDVSSSNTDVGTAWTALFNRYNGNQSATVNGLRAMVAGGNQDMLYVVPLPPAAFAGLATLVGVAGVARLRRR
jgi:hypothetical protein